MKTAYLTLLVSSVLLTACQVKLEQSTVVNGDGSGTLSVVVAVDEEIRELLESAGQDLQEVAEALPPEFDTTGYVGEGLEGIRSIVRFSDLEELNALLAGELGGGQVADGASITRDGDTFSFRASLGDLDEQFAVGEAGSLLTDEVFDDVFDIVIGVRLPGRVIEHNADEVGPNGELRWLITSASTGELTATSTVAVGFSLPLLMVAVAGVGALGFGAAFLLARPTSLGSAPVQ